MKVRVVILTEIIAPYRVPVFNELAIIPEIDLHVVFLAETDTSTRSWQIYSDEIRFSCEVLPALRRRLGKYNLLINRDVSSALTNANPDVLLCGGYNYLASWQALYWAKKHQVPFLLWCESTQKDQRNYYWLIEQMKQKFFAGCNGFVVPGEASFKYVESVAANPRIFRAPNAVDNHLFASRAEDARLRGNDARAQLQLPNRYFLFVGRLVPAKGAFDLLEAYGRLDTTIREQFALVLAGDGPARAELQAAAESIFPGQVHFTGFVHRDELAAYYALAECLVFPTHTDTWGLVVNEAMACGLPVICSDVAGCAADLVLSNGKVIPPRDIAQLSTAMADIASDPQLWTRMSAESKKLISSYSPKHCARGMADAAIAMQLQVFQSPVPQIDSKPPALSLPPSF